MHKIIDIDSFTYLDHNSSHILEAIKLQKGAKKRKGDGVIMFQWCTVARITLTDMLPLSERADVFIALPCDVAVGLRVGFPHGQTHCIQEDLPPCHPQALNGNG